MSASPHTRCDDFQSELAKAKADHLRLVPKSGTPLPPTQRCTPSLGRWECAYLKCKQHQAEVISIVVALLWGSWVGNPTFEVYAIAPDIYAGSARFATELVWGSVVFLAGLITLVGFWRRIDSMRHMGLLGLTWIWAVGFLAAINGPSLWTTAPVSYPVLCWVACWAYFQIDDK